MPTPPSSRSDLVTDAALTLLAERGMRGLTHRAVDQAAGLPQGSTSNHARTREALLEAAVRRLAVREAGVLSLENLPLPAGRPLTGEARGRLAGALAGALHRYLTEHRTLLICRYELALEATRRPNLRAIYDTEGRRFQQPLVAIMAAAGSNDPERHAQSLTAWSEGVLFSCAVGAYQAHIPDLGELQQGFTELLNGILNT
jgi:DNA-binding transcriptional regulator YbjK